MLIGRGPEVERLADFVAGVAAGQASTLCLVGAPGMGKTTLLGAGAELAEDAGVRVVRVTAVEIEHDFSGSVLGVLLPRLGYPDDPEDASPGTLLQSLVAAASSSPLLVCVDDVQWVDARSLRSIVFAARRLLADPVGLLLAGRPEVDRLPEVAELPRLTVPALPEAAALELLETVTPGVLPTVAVEVVRSLGAVPLALVEAASLLTPEALAGRAPLPSPLRVGPAVQDRYARGFTSLPGHAQLAVVVLAADDGAVPTVLGSALDDLGLSGSALEPAETAGLVVAGPRPGFVHPLARAAVYAAASPVVRRQAHAALARADEKAGQTSRALRHEAAAAPGPDERLAEALEREAGRLAERDEAAEAWSAAELAAGLSTDPDARLRRVTLAVEQCPDVHRAEQLAQEVTDSDADPVLVARCFLVRTREGGTGASPTDFDDLLRQIDVREVPAGVRHRLDVGRIWSAIETADVGRLDRLATELDQNTAGSPWSVVSTLGMAYTYLGRHHRGVELLREAVELTGSLDVGDVPLADVWNWAIIPGWLGEDTHEHQRRIDLMSTRFRATGLPALTGTAAFFAAERARRNGAWHRAEALYAESLEMTDALGANAAVELVRRAALAAYRGQVERTAELLRAAERAFDHRSDTWNGYWVDHTRGALALTLGRAEEAAPPLRRVYAAPFVGRGCRDSVCSANADLVETLVALGDLDAARAAADRLTDRLDGIVDPHGLALVQRCGALARPDEAEERFPEALRLHATTDDPFERARTQLLYGEHLRRTRRPRAAREVLRDALLEFERVDAPPWAERARRELAASGETRPARAGRSDADLTPQELRVALAVCDGLSNAETASSLFLSVKTVEFHLGRVYRKLGVRSRGGLSKAMSDQGLSA